jgi:hypothetical protein
MDDDQIWHYFNGSNASCRSSGCKSAGGNYPVATVAITVDGAGDRTLESPVVKILDGWVIGAIMSHPTLFTPTKNRQPEIRKPLDGRMSSMHKFLTALTAQSVAVAMGERCRHHVPAAKFCEMARGACSWFK